MYLSLPRHTEYGQIDTEATLPSVINLTHDQPQPGSLSLPLQRDPGNEVVDFKELGRFGLPTRWLVMPAILLYTVFKEQNLLLYTKYLQITFRNIKNDNNSKY